VHGWTVYVAWQGPLPCAGQVPDTSFDKYLFESDPMLLYEIASQAAPLIPTHTDVLAGLELGGVPVATALSFVTGLPAVFVRKQPKTYGTMKLGEGAEFQGRRPLVIEDVISTGGQVAASTSELRKRGGTGWIGRQERRQPPTHCWTRLDVR
jgi:orotate phosphoribosyltransferase